MDRSEYEVDEVLAARCRVEHRLYLLKYNKWSPDQRCSCSDQITEFCTANGLVVEDMIPEGPNPLLGEKHGHCYRCIWCNNFHMTSGALKGHQSRKVSDPTGCKCKPKSKTVTVVDYILFQKTSS